jgi:hypothetical protein
MRDERGRNVARHGARRACYRERTPDAWSRVYGPRLRFSDRVHDATKR